MATVPTQIRIDTEVKKQANELFGTLGMDMSSAVNIFLKQCILRGGIPFTIEVPQYSQTVLDAMAEAINKAYAELIEKPATDNDKKDDSKKDDSKKDDSKKDDSKKDDSKKDDSKKDNFKKNNSDKKSGAVKTGDATPLILWGAATILAAGASVTVILRRRKRR